MISVSKAWAVSITVCIAICCGVTTVANASLLRAVRVGEHKEFTRLAFEFDSPPRYLQPVLKDKGTILITFSESKTPFTLPSRTLTRNTRHFDTIGFDQQGSDLTAKVTVTYPHFEIKAFTLLTPYRVVMDVYWLDAPSQATVVPPPVLANVIKPAPLEPEETEPQRTEKVTPLPESQDRDVSAEETAPKLTEKIALAPETPESSAPVMASPEKVAIPVNEEATVSQLPETTTTGSMKPAEVTPRYSRLQFYLVMVLAVLNISIIFFTVMGRSRSRRTAHSEYRKNDAIADALAVQDVTVGSIDNEIRKKFRKYETI
ncbi:MAG: hypothetical protein JRC86_02545 [Deltaproteobacteria bacterium]|nr:hypothetical protein [Deltaproteobacteria bacterium]